MGSPCEPLSLDIALITMPLRTEVRDLEQQILWQLANPVAIHNVRSTRDTATLEASIPREAEMQGRAGAICIPAAAEAPIFCSTG
jgi:hypothetical protein